MPAPVYCTVEDVGRFGIKAEALESFSAEDEIAPAAEAASRTIDTYLRDRFTLPLTAWGSEITQAAAIIAAFNLVSTEGFKPNENPEDSIVLIRYEKTLAWLKMVGQGLATPDVTGTPTPEDVPPPNVGRVISNVQRGYQTDAINGAGAFQGRRR